MKLFAGVKGKVLAGTLSVGLLVGGTGAAASANGQTYKEFFSDATKSLVTLMAGWAGLDVQANSKTQQGNIKGVVQTEFNWADSQISGHLIEKVNNGNGVLQDEYSRLSGEIQTAGHDLINDANKKIDATVDKEVDLAKKNLNTTAKNEAQSLINGAKERWAKGANYKETQLIAGPSTGTTPNPVHPVFPEHPGKGNNK